MEQHSALVHVYSKDELIRKFPRDYKGVFAQILRTLFSKGCVDIKDRVTIVDLTLAFFRYKPSLDDFVKLTIVERRDGRYTNGSCAH